MNLTPLSFRLHRVLLASALLFLFCMQCKPKTGHNMSSEAELFLEEVLTLLKKESVHKNMVPWDEVEKEMFRLAQNSKVPSDTYHAVQYAISRLEDNHSYFVYDQPKENNSDNKPLPIPEDEETPADIGYVRLPFCMGDEAKTAQYIKTITEKLCEQNKSDVKGWIIDLRDNFGGNMWPMMVAVGPLLEEGIQGYFFDADQRREAWRYEKSRAYTDTILLAENTFTCSLNGKNKIAVLINQKTASSGEAMAVLFKGYANCKLFGTPTFGVSTGCTSFTLSDGSRINLATSVFMDRNGNKYGKAIPPDVFCEDSRTLTAAIEWINKE